MQLLIWGRCLGLAMLYIKYVPSCLEMDSQNNLELEVETTVYIAFAIASVPEYQNFKSTQTHMITGLVYVVLPQQNVP